MYYSRVDLREKKEPIALAPYVVALKQNVQVHDQFVNGAKIGVCHVSTQSRHSLPGYGESMKQKSIIQRHVHPSLLYLMNPPGTVNLARTAFQGCSRHRLYHTKLHCHWEVLMCHRPHLIGELERTKFNSWCRAYMTIGWLRLISLPRRG
jgi:hypothetical protein